MSSTAQEDTGLIIEARGSVALCATSKRYTYMTDRMRLEWVASHCPIINWQVFVVNYTPAKSMSSLREVSELVAECGLQVGVRMLFRGLSRQKGCRDARRLVYDAAGCLLVGIDKTSAGNVLLKYGWNYLREKPDIERKRGDGRKIITEVIDDAGMSGISEESLDAIGYP